MKYLPFIAAVAVTLSSCTLTKRTAYQQAVAPTAMIQAPLIAELAVDPTKKVSATYMAHKVNEEQAKSSALYAAMDQNGCDVIVQPVFELKIGKKSIEATVKGMCGKYTVMRKPTLEDVTLLQELNDAMPMFDSSIRVIEKRESIFRK
ncbi:MAG: hypothetical protein K9J17_01425 [Flavobacteriales bacterium]|nr:hypothetical protein [Flavobacteriales bacterium]